MSMAKYVQTPRIRLAATALLMMVQPGVTTFRETGLDGQVELIENALWLAASENIETFGCLGAHALSEFASTRLKYYNITNLYFKPCSVIKLRFVYFESEMCLIQNIVGDTLNLVNGTLVVA